MNTPKKVLVVGGGFGGLNAVQALRNSPFEILILDKENHHLFQPLLYQVATAALSSADIAQPIREILSRQKNVTVLMANVVRIDKIEKKVFVENGDSYPFDALILAPGASHSYFGHDDWKTHAPGLKTLFDAVSIREKVLLAYELAERSAFLKEKADHLRFVIVGGGPTGIEMAGAISEIASKSLTHNFRYIKPEQTEIYLIEGQGQILPSFPKKLGKKALSYLEKMGVKVLLNTNVTKVTKEGVLLGNQFLECGNVIWAAGNEASPLLKTLDTPLDRAGRAIVNPDLSIPGSPEIFVIGDAALLKGADGVALPGIAPVAIQQGRYVASLLLEKTKKPFRYWDKGMMATIGKAKAVAVLGKLQFAGYPAWLAWSFIHIFYLVSFPNRILVMLQWFFWYLTNERRVRIINRAIDDHSLPCD